MSCLGCGKVRLFMCQHVGLNKTGFEIQSTRRTCGYCIDCCPDRRKVTDRFPEAKGALILTPEITPGVK